MIERLFSYSENRSVSGLSSMGPIDEWMGHPHRSFSAIHVAGTNGKGSVSLKIASVLTAAGFRVGLYSSPHIEHYRERILVNGEEIRQEFVEGFLGPLFSFLDQKRLKPSFFTLLTALAFAYFKEEKVDFAVIEAGLGGRLDATNVITPRLSVITSIAYDHCEILGQTLEQIAFEKAGIIKKGVPVVVGPRARYPAILAAEQKILVAETKGFYDRENSAIAAAALRTLAVPEEGILKGIGVRPSCRFQVIDPRPIILDVAHNPDGFFRLAEALEELYPGVRFHLILAMGKKRDPVSCVRQISGVVFRISTISNGHEKLYSAEELKNILECHRIKAGMAPPSLKEILFGQEPLLFCGSFYIMGSLSREIMGLKGPII